MVIVILNKRPLTRMKYHELFPEASLHLLTSTNHSSQDEIDALRPYYASVSVFEQYDGNSAVEARVIDIAKTTRIDRLIALSEQDILRAARLRDHFGIDGMRYAEALAFRDKVVMKERLRRADVRTSEFVKVEHASDAYIFADKYGYPLVLKPTRGAGSMGVRVINNRSALDENLASLFTSDFDRENGYMLETFVSGRMYHIDGLTQEGRIIFSRVSAYVNSCLSFQDGTFLGSAMLDRADPLAKSLTEVSVSALSALGAQSSFAFHAEVFACDKTGQLLVCEVASRAGGGPIVDTLIEATGVDLTRVSALLDVYPSQAMDIVHRSQQGLGGFCIFPPRKAKLQSLPEVCPVLSAVTYRAIGKNGTNYGGGKNSIDSVATAIVRAETGEGCVSAVLETAAWFDKQVVWTTGGEANAY